MMTEFPKQNFMNAKPTIKCYEFIFTKLKRIAK